MPPTATSGQTFPTTRLATDDSLHSCCRKPVEYGSARASSNTAQQNHKISQSLNTAERYNSIAKDSINPNQIQTRIDSHLASASTPPKSHRLRTLQIRVAATSRRWHPRRSLRQMGSRHRARILPANSQHRRDGKLTAGLQPQKD